MHIVYLSNIILIISTHLILLEMSWILLLLVLKYFDDEICSYNIY